MYFFYYLIHNNIGDNIDFSTIGAVTYRALISLFTLFIVTKIVGKKQVSELSLFDYVIGISIGNFAAEMTINIDSEEINGILAVIIFGVVAYLVSWLTMKSMFLRRLFIGTPTIIIQNGKLLKKNMRKVRLDINDLLEECRIKGYFDISTIAFGIMEVNGEMSFLPKSEYKMLTPLDMKVKPEKERLLANVIIDGKIMHNNLNLMNKDENWLLQQLKVKGYNDLKGILLCTLDDKQKITIYGNNDDVQVLDILE